MDSFFEGWHPFWFQKMKCITQFCKHPQARIFKRLTSFFLQVKDEYLYFSESESFLPLKSFLPPQSAGRIWVTILKFGISSGPILLPRGGKKLFDGVKNFFIWNAIFWPFLWIKNEELRIKIDALRKDWISITNWIFMKI